MLLGNPAFAVGEPRKVKVDEEEKSATGFVLTSQFDPIECVLLDASAALRIVKHARDNAPHRATGELLGIQLSGTVEVWSVLPSLSSNTYTDKPSEAEKEKWEEEDRKERQKVMNTLRQTGMGGVLVGTYQASSQSSYFAAEHLNHLQASVQAGNPALFIAYDPLRSQLGKLHLRAFTLSPSVLRALNAPEGAKERTADTGTDSPIREVPVKFTSSSAGKSILHRHVATRSRDVRNAIVEQGGIERYNERLLQAHVEGMEKLRSDLQYTSYYNADATQNTLKLDTRLRFTQLRDQASHLSNVAKGGNLNLHFASITSAE